MRSKVWASDIAVRGLPTAAKITARDPPRAIVWTLDHCPSSSEWESSRNTGEIRAARKGTGHSTSQSRWPRTSVHCNRHLTNVRIVYEAYPYLYIKRSKKGEWSVAFPLITSS